MDMSRYRALFFSEAREHLDEMGRLALLLEQQPEDRGHLDALFRAAHSVKGMAAAMGFERTAALAHSLESQLEAARQGQPLVDVAMERLLRGVDLLEAMIAGLAAGEPEGGISDYLESPAAAPAEADKAESSADAANSARVLDIELRLKPDTPMPAARLLIIHNHLARLGTIGECVPDVEALRGGEVDGSLRLGLRGDIPEAEVEAALASHGEIAGFSVRVRPLSPPGFRMRRDDQLQSVRVHTELLDDFINLAGEMLTNRHRLQTALRHEDRGELHSGVEELARLVSSLHHQVLKLRLMPLGTVTGHLPRMVRELARAQGKEVEFVIDGAELELDRAILEKLGDPLLHMVRNAVDHGIVRHGRVSLHASREKDVAVIEVSDTGRGMDPEKLRARAVDKGFLSEAEARQLRDREALELIFRPGFSTAETISATSGRGVGMDVVKHVVDSLGGRLDLTSAPGRGTRVRLELPLAVAIATVLLVECAGHQVGIPIGRIQRLLSLGREDIRVERGKSAILLDDERVPLLSLRKLLRLPVSAPGDSLAVVVCEIRGRRVGLAVDALAGQREVFVKALTPPLDLLPGMTGSTILGDGRLLFIIDPQLLLAETRRPAAGGGAP